MFFFFSILQAATNEHHFRISMPIFNENLINQREIFYISITYLLFEYIESNEINLYDTYYKKAIKEKNYYELMDYTNKLLISILNKKNENLLIKTAICDTETIISYFQCLNIKKIKHKALEEIFQLYNYFENTEKDTKEIEIIVKKIIYFFIREIKNQSTKPEKFYKKSLELLDQFKSKKYTCLNCNDEIKKYEADTLKNFTKTYSESTLIFYNLKFFITDFLKFIEFVINYKEKNNHAPSNTTHINKESFNIKYTYLTEIEVHNIKKWTIQCSSDNNIFFISFYNIKVITNTIEFWLQELLNLYNNSLNICVKIFIDKYIDNYFNILKYFVENIIVYQNNEKKAFIHDEKIFIYKNQMFCK